MKSSIAFSLICSLCFLSFSSQGWSTTAPTPKPVCEGKKKPDLSLAIAIDVSGSTDGIEMAIQLEGYKKAFDSEEVKDNLLNCSCTEVSVILWAKKAKVLFEPLILKDESDISKLTTFFSELMKTPDNLDSHHNLSSTTEIADALRFTGVHLLKRKAHEYTINISGDGYFSLKHRSFEAVAKAVGQVRTDLYNKGITVNGIPVINLDYTSDTTPTVDRRSGKLTSYRDKSVVEFYEHEVITPYGFINPASSYQDIQEPILKAMERDTCPLQII